METASTRTLVGRWQTRGGRYWYELLRDENGQYSYRSENGGGHIGPSRAVAHVRLKRYMDDAKTIDGITYRKVA